MGKSKKIGIFTGYFLPHLGGVERYVDKLAVALVSLGYDIVIVTSNEGGLKNYEKNNKYTLYRLPILNIARNRYPIPKLNAEYRTLIDKVRGEGIDYFIVNTRFHLTSLIGARLGRKYKKPVMLIEHGTDHFTVNNKIIDCLGTIYEHLLTAIVKRYVDKFYGVSRNCNIWMRHFRINASGVFYNAIDVNDETRAKNTYNKKYPKNVILITYAGRLIKEKGILNLLRAFKRIEKEYGDGMVRLAVAGDGALYNEIKENYQDSNIDILGRLDFDQVMSLYKRTDIFVYPSMYPEGLPTSILEAGLMGCAVIATPRGGTEEVIIDDDHGIIIDGSTESLYNSISLLVDNPAKKLRQANNIKKRIQMQFDWHVVAEAVDKEIKEFGLL